MKVKGRDITCSLISFTAICLVATPGSRACPRRCACYVSTEVHCTFRYLTSIPDGIPPNVERINLGYNSLARLTEMDFSGLNKLEFLMLHSNGIHTIADRAFSGLQALQVLKMSYNKVRKLQKDTFYGLRSLTRLHMDHNNIEFINPQAFYGLTLLRLVHLEGNQLTKLHADTFVSLRYVQIFKMSFIKYLYLSDNFLTSLPQELVSYMPTLESLYLHGNPWSCDCHMKWLSEWMLEKPDVIKCKKDRSPSSPQQCPLCMGPRVSRGKLFAAVPVAAFLCAKPVIDPSLKSRHLTVLDDSASAHISPQDFVAPLGSLTLNMTDQSGNEANMVCSIRKPPRALPIALAEENDHITLNAPFSTFLVCNVDYSHIQPVWQVLALYSDAPLMLKKSHSLPETPQHSYRYKQVAGKPEDIFTNIEADLSANPSWLMQDQLSLQLNRTTTTLSTLQIQFSTDAQITSPRAELRPEEHKWTMIQRFNDTKLEHTVVAGGTITLECPGQGDPAPHLEWLLADGSKVRAPYVSGDGRILVDRSGRLELQMADSFDTGVYHCISTNYHDADVLTYRVTVVEPHREASHENGAHRTVFIGKTLDLPCHSAGVPDASISWVLPGNTVLHQSSRGKQILDNGTLRILQVTPEDQGHYHCVAANPSGVDFLIFQVSVKMKGQRPVGHSSETEGSGADEPGDHFREPPVKLPTSAPLQVEVGKPVSSISKKSTHRELTQGQRGESTSQHFRKHWRQFLPSARRIDPRHWATLLEKAKKSAMPGKQENTMVWLPSPATQVMKGPGEEKGASGMLSLGEDGMGLPTQASSVPARTYAVDSRAVSHTIVTITTPSPAVNPVVSPYTPQVEKARYFKLPNAIETTATSKTISPTLLSKMQDTTNQNSTTIFPPLLGVTEFRNPDQMERRGEPLQGALPVSGRTEVRDMQVNTLNSTDSRANAVTVLQSASATGGGQTPVAGVTEDRSGHFYSHRTQTLRTSRFRSDPHSADHFPFWISRNSTARVPLPRRFGRWRRIWGRGRTVHPYRMPAVQRHRYGIMRPTLKSMEESTAAFSAAELCAGSPSCPPSRLLISTSAALSFPGSPCSALPRSDLARVTTEESTTLVQNPPLLFEDKQNVDIEKTTPTMTYFSAEPTQVVPAGAIMTHAPTPVSLGKTLTSNNDFPRVASTHEAKRDLVITLPLSGPLTKPSAPTRIASVRFSRRKIPWHQIFANSHKQKGTLKNAYVFSLPRSTATMLSHTAGAVHTDKDPSPSTAPSARLMETPSGTLATTHHSPTETHGPTSLPTRKGLHFLHFPPFHPLLPTAASGESSTVSFLSVPTATLVTPTAPASVIINKTQTARPRAQKVQRIKETQVSGKDPRTSPGQSSGFALSAAVTAPVLTSTKPGVSAFTPPHPEDTSKLVSTFDFHSRTTPLMAPIQALPPESAWTWRSTAASETAIPSRSQEGTTAPPVPIPTSPTFPQSPVPDNLAMLVSELTDKMVKLQQFPRSEAKPLRSAAKLATPPEVDPDAEVAAGPTPSPYSRVGHSAPGPALRTVESQDPTEMPALQPKNHFWHKSYPETAREGKKPVVGMLLPLSLPESPSRASNWGGQNAKKSGFDLKLVQKPLPTLSPSDALSGTALEKPRMVGGRAASFTVSADAEAFLPCEAVGNPPPSIHWTRVFSGLELSKKTQSGRFRVLPNGTLSIQRVSIQDRGQYLCLASSPLGTDRLHITLSVVSYPPQILDRHTKEITIHSGSTVELRCRAEGRPSPTIAWILANRTVVLPSEEKRTATVTPEGTLVIHSLSIYDRGLYKCVASNSAGQDSLLVRIQVIAAPPAILESKRQVIAGTQGEGLQLACTAKGTPQPSVHWVLPDGTEVKAPQLANSKFQLQSNGTLYIRDVVTSDRGTYECIATSSTGSERRVVILTVEKQETLPTIEAASQKWTEVNFGDKLLLNCSATGEPKPRIIWRLPSKAVIDQWHRMGSQIHVYPNGSLFIASVTEKDGGDYLCVARNRMGDDFTLMHVSLQLKPAKIDHKQHIRKQVLHGKEFHVDCKASGSPVPQISWSLPDGTMINAMQADDSGRRTKRYTLFDNGTLYFNKVGIAEEGDYTCYAQNTLGKDEMKVHLTVVTAAPRIRQGYTTNRRVNAGATAVLDCEVIGEPTPSMFWLLPSSNRISFSRGRHTFHANGSLSIHKVSLQDSGEYVCVARNPSGDDTKTYRLEVVSTPPVINGLYTNRTVIRATAVRHSKKHFACSAEGTPASQITWVVPGGVPLAAPYYGSRITVHKNGTLEIRNVRPSDSADFVCVARNEAGESVLVVRLEVQEMLRRPTFRNPFNEKVVAQLGKPTTLTCSVDGNPPPEMIWILPNGTRFSNGLQNSEYLTASNGSLVISRTTRSSAGKYRCAARNQVGYIEKLIVLEIGQKPVILTHAQGTVRCISGESLALHCVSDGIPKPHVQWATPSGYILDRTQVNGKYTLHENGTLAIKAATAYDRGNYICKAQNSVGHAMITVPVMIVAYPPRITKRPPRSIFTRTGAAFQLHCMALGVPKPEVTWERPDHSLLSRASKGRAHGSELLHPQGTLVIQDPQTADSGLYKCTAKNPLGSDYATTYIQVI